MNIFIANIVFPTVLFDIGIIISDQQQQSGSNDLKSICTSAVTTLSPVLTPVSYTHLTLPTKLEV